MIHKEELWLLCQWHLKIRELLQLLIDKVKFYNPFSLCEDNVLGFFTSFSFLEVKLHRNFIEFWVIFDNYSFIKFEYIRIVGVLISYSSKNEKLIWFLFVHNEILPGNDSNVVFIVGKLHTDDLVLFTGIRFEERDLK